MRVFLAWFDFGGPYEPVEFLGVYSTHRKAVEAWAQYASSVHGRVIDPAEAAFDPKLRIDERDMDAGPPPVLK